jgi:thioredoxin-like negative regulator of GroEL
MKNYKSPPKNSSTLPKNKKTKGVNFLILVAIAAHALFCGVMFLCVRAAVDMSNDLKQPIQLNFLFPFINTVHAIETPPATPPPATPPPAATPPATPPPAATPPATPPPAATPPSEGPKPPTPLSQFITTLDAATLGNAKSPNSTTFWVVKFFRENCPHCKRLAPDYAKLADDLNATANLKFGEVDCISSSILCDENRIDGVPTIKIFYKGSTRNHDGGRDVASLTKWVEDSMANDGEHVKKPPPPPPPPPPPEAAKPLTPSIIALNVTTLAAARADPNNFTVVLFFRVNCPHCARFRPDYSKVADSLNTTASLLFGEVDCPANGIVCNQNQVRGVPTLKIFYKNSVRVHDGSRDVASVIKWVQESMANDGELVKNPPPPPPPPPPPEPAKPLTISIQSLNATTLTEAQSKNSTTFWVVKFFRENCPHCKRLAPDYAKVADNLNNTANLKFGEVDCPANNEVCNKNGIEGVPTVKLFYKGATIVHDGDRTVDGITKWITESIANNGERILNPAPATPPPATPPPATPPPAATPPATPPPAATKPLAKDAAPTGEKPQKEDL